MVCVATTDQNPYAPGGHHREVKELFFGIRLQLEVVSRPVPGQAIKFCRAGMVLQNTNH